jgi:hypothetical protein
VNDIALATAAAAILHNRTGRVIPLADAADACRAILGGRVVSDPVAYVGRVLQDDPNPGRFLPAPVTSTPVPAGLPDDLAFRAEYIRATDYGTRPAPRRMQDVIDAMSARAIDGASTCRALLGPDRHPAGHTPRLHGPDLAAAQVAEARAERAVDTMPHPGEIVDGEIVDDDPGWPRAGWPDDPDPDDDPPFDPDWEGEDPARRGDPDDDEAPF